MGQWSWYYHAQFNIQSALSKIVSDNILIIIIIFQRKK